MLCYNGTRRQNRGCVRNRDYSTLPSLHLLQPNTRGCWQNWRILLRQPWHGCRPWTHFWPLWNSQSPPRPSPTGTRLFGDTFAKLPGPQRKQEKAKYFPAMRRWILPNSSPTKIVSHAACPIWIIRRTHLQNKQCLWAAIFDDAAQRDAVLVQQKKTSHSRLKSPNIESQIE